MVKIMDKMKEIWGKMKEILNLPITKKVFKITLDVFFGLFVALCLVVVGITMFAKRDADGTPEVFGAQIRIVTSDSMAKCDLTDVSKYDIKSIKVRTMIFIDLVPNDPQEAKEWYSKLEVGDVLTFKYVYNISEGQIPITHRIINKVENASGGYTIDLAGDNKNAEGGQLIQTINTAEPESLNYIVGKVTSTNYLFGLIMSLFKTKVGLILIIMVPCVIIMVLEIMRIIKVLKKGEQPKKEANQEDELESLRRRIAELEAKKSEDE